MKFRSGTRRRALEYEKDWVKRWKADKTFEKSVENRSKENGYVFYDGPPFISGNPHHGTLLSSIVKDAIPRYQTMKGKRVERVWGWDCHGLPAERFTEKKLGLQSREDVIGYGIEKYITACRSNMVQTSSEWEDVVDRIGRWVDFKGAYKTMDKDYMESVWWAFKELYEKGKIYEGEKVLMYCTLDATPLSKAEVTMDAGAYQEVTDPSVYVKFKLKDGRTLLAWTTTPWTLPANMALAVNEKLTYIEVKTGDEQFIVAKELVEKVMQDEKHQLLNYEVLREFKGCELVGLNYEPILPIPEGMGENPVGRPNITHRTETRRRAWLRYDNDMYRVVPADFVDTDSGTGIVHIAPSYGEDDFELAKSMNVPGFNAVDENGNYYQPVAQQLYELADWLDSSKPLNIWEYNKDIAKALLKKRIVWKIDYIRHSYPHCHRCGTKLMYRAHPSWFMDIEGQRTEMLENNQPINWFPPHVKNGRFAKTIEQAPDWNLSRDRFWATAMPVWKSESGKIRVVGSYAELKELSGIELEDYHRPWIDDVTFEIDGEKYTRIDKVMDCWFESGSMPFAQFHYPFENKEKFEANFPGDFIVEYIGQVRAWFYYVHAVNTALFGTNAFKNVIVTGNVAGNDGRKMSKSYGNYTDPNELMDKFSADSLRFLLLSSPLLSGEDFALQDKEVGDIARKLSMIWNMYDFFTMYAEVDGWEFDGDLRDPLVSLSSSAQTASRPTSLEYPSGSDGAADVSPDEIDDVRVTNDPSGTVDIVKNPLDVWIISRLHQLVAEVEKHMDGYNLPDAMSPILPFLDDASNWYVRRSRRRFWKSEDDDDKNNAYKTLHYVLTRLAYVLAPFAPFMAEELYRNMTGDKESIHLKDWLGAGRINKLVMNDMEKVRDYVNQGLSLRAKAGLKVRQPLAKVTLNGSHLSDYYKEILKEELNVKQVMFNTTLEVQDATHGVSSGLIALETALTPELKREGLMREVIRYVQNARKKAGLNVDDRISLQLTADDKELSKAIDEHAKTIKTETLTEQLDETMKNGYTEKVTIEGSKITISLKKV